MPRKKKQKKKFSPTKIDVAVGNKIKELRIANQLTQLEFSKLLKVSANQIYKYEVAMSRVSLSQLIFLAKKFKFDLGEFLEGLKGVDFEISNAKKHQLTLIKYFSKLDEKDQEMILTTTKVMANNYD